MKCHFFWKILHFFLALPSAFAHFFDEELPRKLQPESGRMHFKQAPFYFNQKKTIQHLSHSELSFFLSSPLIGQQFFVFSKLRAVRMGPTINFQNSGLGDQTFGAYFRAISVKPFQIDFQLQGDVSAYSAQSYRGDGIQSLSFLLKSSWVLFKLESNVGFGIQWRSFPSLFENSRGPRQVFPWTLSIAYPLQKCLIQIQLRGMLSTLSQKNLSPLDLNLLTKGVSLPQNSWTWLGVGLGFPTSENQKVSLYLETLIQSSLPEKAFQFGIFYQWDHLWKQKEEKFSHSVFSEGEIIAINERLHLVKMNKGSQNGMKVGDLWVIYDSNKIIAVSKIIAVKPYESVLQISEYLSDKALEKGFRMVPKDQD